MLYASNKSQASGVILTLEDQRCMVMMVKPIITNMTHIGSLRSKAAVFFELLFLPNHSWLNMIP